MLLKHHKSNKLPPTLVKYLHSPKFGTAGRHRTGTRFSVGQPESRVGQVLWWESATGRCLGWVRTFFGFFSEHLQRCSPCSPVASSTSASMATNCLVKGAGERLLFWRGSSKGILPLLPPQAHPPAIPLKNLCRVGHLNSEPQPVSWGHLPLGFSRPLHLPTWALEGLCALSRCWLQGG